MRGDTLTHRGATIMHTDMPGDLWTWTHDATDGHGIATSLPQARTAIDNHLARHAAPQHQKVTT